jgi:hypothetical protein
MAARESKKPQNKTDKRIVGSQKRRKKYLLQALLYEHKAVPHRPLSMSHLRNLIFSLYHALWVPIPEWENINIRIE